MKFWIIILFSLSICAAKIELPKSFNGYNFTKSTKQEIKLPKSVNVFVFLSATCPCSNSYFDYLNELSQKFSNMGFYGFHSSKSTARDVAEKYFKKFDLKFPIIEDKDLSYADTFGALKTPHVFVLDNGGEILFHGAVADTRHMTQAKDFFLEDALKNISNGKKPEITHAKALGCYIVR